MLIWVDRPSYSQDDAHEIISSVEATIGEFRVIIHRHVHTPGTWLVSCYDLCIIQHDLTTDVLAIAKEKAIDYLIRRLGRYVLLRDKLIFERGTHL